MNEITIKKSELHQKKHKILKAGKKQILLLESQGQYYAIDNRCPHEGYPLSQGDINDESCVLTCNWHNWKFDLKNGECLIGGDDVVTYPVRSDDDKISIDLSGPPKEVLKARITKGLKEAFEKRQFARLAREITRLHFNEIDPTDAVKLALGWCHDKFEYGTTHAFAALADWLQLYQKEETLEGKILALTEGIDYLAFDSLREKSYPFAQNTDRDFEESAFLQAIENEDAKLSEELAIAGIESGKRYTDFYPLLSKAALSHYQDFGHSAIYVYKSKFIADFFESPEIDKILVLNMTRSLVYATREDLIPEFKHYQSSLEQLETIEFGGEKNNRLAVNAENIKQSFDWVIKNAPHYDFESLYDGMLFSNAENLLNYNIQYQNETHNSVKDNVGWLSFTHAITFSNAAKKLSQENPQLQRQTLLQMAAFFGRNINYTDRNQKTETWKLSFNESNKKIFVETLKDHGQGLPIFSAHLLKTMFAVFEECDELQERTQTILMTALNRLFHSPIKQKHVQRIVNQAIELVARDY